MACLLDPPRGNSSQWAEWVGAIRAVGVSIGFDALSSSFGFSTAGASRLKPDIASFGGRKLAMLCGDETARRLWRLAAARLRDDGITLHAWGIMSPRELEFALETGADLVQGDWLAPAVPGGSDEGFDALNVPA